MRASIWTENGRAERTGQRVKSHHLSHLRLKRIKQLKHMMLDIPPKKRARLEARLAYLE